MTKCTSKSGRHSWKHLRNIIETVVTGRRARISQKGVYECKTCSKTKLGAHQ